jgi:hypothetical protein
MNAFHSLSRSIILSAVACFTFPIVIAAGTIGTVRLCGMLPGIAGLGRAIDGNIFEFLSIFGKGSPSGGIFAIAITCAFVGCLFDIYAFFNFQIERSRG